MSAKIFTTAPGAALEVGHYGMATNNSPAVVPDEVASQLEAETRSDIRVERESAPPPSAASKPSTKAAPPAAEEK